MREIMIPIVIGALGTKSKGLENRLEEVEIRKKKSKSSRPPYF